MKLTIEPREDFGSNASHKLRRSGRIPAIAYGQGKPLEHFSLEANEFSSFLRGKDRIISLKMPKSKKVEQFLLKDIQYDHLGDEVYHVDFVRVDVKAKTTLSIPIEYVGTPVGQKEGGVLDTQAMEVSLEIAPKDAPEKIVVKLMDMQLNDVLKFKDLDIPSGADLNEDPEGIVVMLKAAAEEKEESELGAPSMPEVITAKKEEEED